MSSLPTGALLACLAILAACAGSPAPIPAPPISADAGPPVVAGALRVPARIGLLRLSGGRAVPVPASEHIRWQGAIAEVNRVLVQPIRLTPIDPGSGGAAPGQPAALAETAGLDAIVVYELSVAVADDPVTAGLAQVPLLGGIVPVSAATRANGEAVARLYLPRREAPIAETAARMHAAEIASLRRSGGSGPAMRALAEYAMLHRLVPAAEDMLVGAVTAGR